jgi:hypothetical protein
MFSPHFLLIATIDDKPACRARQAPFSAIAGLLQIVTHFCLLCAINFERCWRASCLLLKLILQ